MNWNDAITSVWAVGEIVTVDELVIRIRPGANPKREPDARTKIRKAIRSMQKYGMAEHIGTTKWFKVWKRTK